MSIWVHLWFQPLRPSLETEQVGRALSRHSGRSRKVNHRWTPMDTDQAGTGRCDLCPSGFICGSNLFVRALRQSKSDEEHTPGEEGRGEGARLRAPVGLIRPGVRRLVPVAAEIVMGSENARTPHCCGVLAGMGATGFEPVKAEPADLQSAPFGHLGTRPGCARPGGGDGNIRRPAIPLQARPGVRAGGDGPAHRGRACPPTGRAVKSGATDGGGGGTGPPRATGLTAGRVARRRHGERHLETISKGKEV